MIPPGRQTAESGIVLVDKPQGWTSHQVVGRCRRLLGTRKVGHAGTLDPMATGLLIIGVNRATRLLGHIAGHDKTYLATIRLGQSSTTDDAEGELSEVVPATSITDEQLEAAMAELRGCIQQVPSSVSAIKVDGKRAYAMVRAGEQVELKSREVEVTRFSLDARREVGDWLELDVTVDCSSGTYIRALARDLGRSLGVGGHLTMLRRTRIGGFHLPDSPPDLDGDDAPVILPMGQVAAGSFPVLELDDQQAGALRHGQRIRFDCQATTAALHHGELIALLEADREDGWAKPLAVLAGPR